MMTGIAAHILQVKGINLDDHTIYFIRIVITDFGPVITLINHFLDAVA